MDKHISVLLEESIEGLNIKEDGIYVDGTLGGGGHSLEILKRIPKGELIGIDQDEFALEFAKQRLSEYDNIIYERNNFSNIQTILDNLNINKVDGVLLDLGVSSFQLDQEERGFSYMQDAPLDMRMDNRQRLSAYEVVNNYSEEELDRVISEYGEERWAKRIAEFIVNEREEKPINTTFELVTVIKKAIPKKVRESGPHPARRTFQGIRIEVNDELNVLKQAVNDMVDRLNPKGRICIISFHSLEDRIVKNIFRELEDPCTCPRELPICVCGKKPQIKIITRRPIEPEEIEVEDNIRSRSGKLRIAEKL